MSFVQSECALCETQFLSCLKSWLVRFPACQPALTSYIRITCRFRLFVFSMLITSCGLFIDILYYGNQKLEIKLFAASNPAPPPLRHQTSGSGASNKSFKWTHVLVPTCVCMWRADQQSRRFCTFFIIVAITPIADCSRPYCWCTRGCCHSFS